MTLSTTIDQETIRVIDSNKEGYEMPQYDGMVVVRYLPNSIAVAGPAKGPFTKGDVKCISAHIKSRGAHTLYAERSPGHRLPRGEEATQGPFAGMWRVVL